MVHSLLSLWTVWRLELAQSAENIVPVTILMAMRKMANFFYLIVRVNAKLSELFNVVMVSSLRKLISPSKHAV